MKKLGEYLINTIVVTVGSVLAFLLFILAALLAALPWIVVIATAIILAAFFLELGPFNPE